MVYTPMDIQADLSEIYLEKACSLIWGAHTLTVSSGDLKTGWALSKAKGLVLHLDDALPAYSWYVTGVYSGVFSMGA